MRKAALADALLRVMASRARRFHVRRPLARRAAVNVRRAQRFKVAAATSARAKPRRATFFHRSVKARFHFFFAHFVARVLAVPFFSALRWRWRIRRPRGHVVSGLSGQPPQVHGNADKSLRRAAAARDALARDALVLRSVFLLPMALM